MALQSVGISPRALSHSRAHRHPFYEIVLNLEGVGTTDIGGERSVFFPGSVHIVPPGVPHTKETDETFRDIYFHTDTLPFALTGAVAFQDDGAESLRQLMQMMLFRYLQEQPGDRVLEQMYELALSIIAEAYRAVPIDPTVERLLRQLELSFNDPELSVGELLKGSGYHKDHIRRKFLSIVGMTPSEYLTHLRIEHAKKLLAERCASGLSVATIGEMCGYYDARYFARIFKKATGEMPTSYGAKER